MELSKESWHYKLYRLMYGDKEPTNFCPYFWKGIVLGCIFIVPLYIVFLPLLITEFLFRRFSKEDKTSPLLVKEGFISHILFGAIIYNIAIFLAICMIAMWFYSFNGKNSIVFFGVVGWLIIIACIIAWRLDTQGKRERKYKENKPNVWKEGIKAWYKRNCPIITWKK